MAEFGVAIVPILEVVHSTLKGILDFLEKIGPSGDNVLGDEMIELADEVFEELNH